ncbi:MAG: dihydroxyacetone kinase subunit DhaK [Bacillota bacterium]|nr:dihydroxyacetone kinase subunit DhaK [Bacillota bacterium]
MKKLINRVEDVVDEMLDGFAAAHADRVRRLEGTQVIVRADAPVRGKVALVSGGGSGHEPAHAGYVGEGMLDAAVAGAVFTSPTPDQVLAAIRAVDGGAGVLLIIKNYTGDVMNFEMAAEMARAEGIRVEQVVVADDVAVENSTFTTGRRGIAGTVLVHKIAGAAAAAGRSLDEVKAVAEKVIASVRSMGMALSPCTVPAAGKPTFELAEDEVEIGIGIHGEPGVRREALRPAREIVAELAAKVLDDLPFQRGDRVVALLNGMGATPLSELYVAYHELRAVLRERGVEAAHSLVGEFMTSLEMAGFSVTLLRLDDELERYFLAPSQAVAFRR